jgi:hypothetical protein
LSVERQRAFFIFEPAKASTMSHDDTQDPGYEDNGAKSFVTVFTIAALVIIFGLVGGFLWG